MVEDQERYEQTAGDKDVSFKIYSVTRRDRIKNDYLRYRFKVDSLKDIIKIKRLEWFGHAIRMEKNKMNRKALERIEKGRPRITWKL